LISANDQAPKAPLRILIIDDHPLFQDGLAVMLRKFDDAVEVRTAYNAESGLAVARTHELDLVLLDLGLPGMDGHSALCEFRRDYPALPIIVLSASDEPDDVSRAIHAGALGYIPKSSPTYILFAALRQVLEGNVYIPAALRQAEYSAPPVRTAEPPPAAPGEEPLSLRQLEVLAHLCQGLSNRQIAEKLSLSEKTIKGYVTGIFRALGVVNRTQAVLAAKKLGMSAT
jgi:DNA-binding NarL/FixJ family response regulator